MTAEQWLASFLYAAVSQANPRGLNVMYLMTALHRTATDREHCPLYLAGIRHVAHWAYSDEFVGGVHACSGQP